MDRSNAAHEERNFFNSGVKVATLVIVLGSIAIFADYSLMTGHEAPAQISAPHTMPVERTTDGFDLPPGLHPTSADVSAPVQSF